MIWIHKKRLFEWCNSNLDLLIIVTGMVILSVARQLVDALDLDTRWQNAEFWIFLTGVIIVSVGASALICYRILLKWHSFFS
jgi:hypothetical protein